ncbi:MAG: SPFH domain-containing protein [Bacillota bacterium]|jgi:regulator of protease activity HflC (stomatin/prohibitin superfamily)
MKARYTEEIELKAPNGMGMLIVSIMLVLLDIAVIVLGAFLVSRDVTAPGTILLIVGILYSLVCWIPFLGLKVLKPQEALVLTLFGKYIGTLKGEGFFYVNPFCAAVNPAADAGTATATEDENPVAKSTGRSANVSLRVPRKVISLKAMTLNNNKQKVNDELGNPVEIGVVVIWRVVNTVKAVFNVDNYKAFLSIQCDAALRDIARLYPYDVEENGEMSLRGSSREVADRLRAELQSRVEIAGLEVMEARITHLAYAPEIAAAMLQRQQASAIIAARKMIVDGAVGMVEMALNKLGENNVVHLDEERKAAMVSNLLVVLCGNRDAQPVVNSGSLY